MSEPTLGFLHIAHAEPAWESYPTCLGVWCDRCGCTWRGDFTVTDAMSEAVRFDVVRAYVRRNQGWTCDQDGDFCPACAPAPRRGPLGRLARRLAGAALSAIRACHGSTRKEFRA